MKIKSSRLREWVDGLPNSIKTVEGIYSEWRGINPFRHDRSSDMMDLNQNLILVKGRDQTADIAQWKYDSGYLLITYAHSGQTYRYSEKKVSIYRDPTVFDPSDYCVLKNGQALSRVVRIQQFERHIRVFYQGGYHELFARESVALMPSCLREADVKKRFSYFRALANADTLTGSDGIPILSKQFDKIAFVREDCMLSAYLRGKPFQNRTSAAQTLYYPFGFNVSQKKAVDDALNSRLSVIEGPPGTGKTQTILNIIANILMRGQSVAVVSGNNAATENVEDKLKKYGVDFISAFLGSAAKKEAFLLHQKKIPDLSAWKCSVGEVQRMLTALPAMQKALEEKLQKKNALSMLQCTLEALKLEQQHFRTYYAETHVGGIDFRSIRKLSAQALLRLVAQCERLEEHGKRFSLGQKIGNFLQWGIYNGEFYHNSLEYIVSLCQNRFYETRRDELEKEIASLEQELSAYDFGAVMQKYTDLSMALFRQWLAQKYGGSLRGVYSEADLWKNPETFLRDYPVILSTAHSLRSSLSNGLIYDYVIVDEASQVNVITGALVFSCAKHAVVVGDPKQLSNVVDREMKRRTDAVFDAYALPEAYRYATHSLLSSVTELFADLPRTLLREHYRCSPKIIDFCNQKYYNNQLIILTRETADRMPLVAYKTVPGNHARDHLNQRQIDMILEEVFPQQKLDPREMSIGIVTPYRNQADALQRTFAGTGITADTVDKFQGQERDVIILSTVDNDISDFADEDHRLNVAVSRAVKQLIVLVSGNTPTRETGIGDLVNYIGYHRMDVLNSEIYSVFDLLYTQYADVRRALLTGRKRVSEFDSENLLFGIVTDVLKKECFGKYEVVLHVPLRMILRDLSRLTSDREVQFVMNLNTHVDFLIYDRLSHQPVLIVEADGERYHRIGTKQEERDHLKDQICARYHLPLERFRTTGSRERERFTQALERVTVGEGKDAREN